MRHKHSLKTVKRFNVLHLTAVLTTLALCHPANLLKTKPRLSGVFYA